MKGRILATVVVILLIAGVIYRVQTRDAGDDGPRGGDRALSVKAVPVTVRDFPRVLDLPATLEAAEQVAVVAQAGGIVEHQHVQEGDSVRAGQLLFTLDARPAQARAAQGEAALAGARAETAEAQKKVERLQPLQKSGYISQQEYDDAFLALEAARARTGTARAELRAAQLDVQYAQVRAPIAGRVGHIDVRAGSLVQAGGAPLTTILAPGTLDARASVTQDDWAELAAARAQGKVAAEVVQPGAPDRRVRGELAFVDAQVEPTTGTVPIKVRLATAPPTLLPGQGVQLRLLLGALPKAIVVPEAALQHAQQGPYVYVARDGRAVVQPVTPLRALDGEVAVAGALRAGEAVLVEIPQRLKAGGQVKLESARR
jgi:RND family efflux transporter MFP subunit